MPSPADFDVLCRVVDDRLAADDARGALDLVRRTGRELAAEQGAAFRKLVSRIPETEWHDDAVVATALGTSFRAAGSPSGGAALGYFRAAEATLGTASDLRDGDRAAIWLGHAAALRTQGKLAAAAGFAEQASALVTSGAVRSVQLRVELGARSALELGMLDLHLGRLEEAQGHLEHALGLADQLSRAERVECLGGLALVDYTHAELVTADLKIADARSLMVGTSLLESGFAAPSLTAQMLVALERHDLDAAADVEPVLAAAADHNEWHSAALVAAGYLRFVRDEPIQGLDLLQRARQAERSWDRLGVAHDSAELLRASILVALDHGDEAWEILAGLDPHEHHELCPARVIGQLRFAHGDLVGAADALRDCDRIGDAHSPRTLVDVRMLRAAIEYERGNYTVSDVSADIALVTMARTGSRAPLRALPARTLAGLATRALARRQDATVRDILTGILERTADDSPSIEPLSPRERLVLAEVERGLTVAAIAAELYISPNTVKTHLRRLYRKLGVASRADAIRKARSLGLDREKGPQVTRDSPVIRPEGQGSG